MQVLLRSSTGGFLPGREAEGTRHEWGCGEHPTVPTCTLLHLTTLPCTLLHPPVPHCTHMHPAEPHYTRMHLIVPPCILLHPTVPCCTPAHHAAPHCIVLHPPVPPCTLLRPAAVGPHLPRQHQQPRVSIVQWDGRPARERRVLSQGHPSVQHPDNLGSDPAPSPTGTRPRPCPGEEWGRMRPCWQQEGSARARQCR